MDVVRLLHLMLARAIGRNVRHRTRPIERDQGDDVLETVGPHVEQRPPHALAFQLEHADRFSAGQQIIGALVVERDRRQIDDDAAARQQLHGGFQHSQRLQAEEVELHKTGLLHPLHIELGDRHVRLGIAIERHQFRQPAIANDDAGGMRRGVPRQAFEFLGNAKSAFDHRIAVGFGLQLRFVLDRFGQRNGRCRILRHHLAQFIDLPVRHLQHAADVA